MHKCAMVNKNLTPALKALSHPPVLTEPCSFPSSDHGVGTLHRSSELVTPPSLQASVSPSVKGDSGETLGLPLAESFPVPLSEAGHPCLSPAGECIPENPLPPGLQPPHTHLSTVFSAPPSARLTCPDKVAASEMGGRGDSQAGNLKFRVLLPV